MTDELIAVFEQDPGVQGARDALAAADAEDGRLGLTEWLNLAPVLRLAFRFLGVRLRPVPFPEPAMCAAGGPLQEPNPAVAAPQETKLKILAVTVKPARS